jgi:hypothetical protein
MRGQCQRTIRCIETRLREGERAAELGHARFNTDHVAGSAARHERHAERGRYAREPSARDDGGGCGYVNGRSDRTGVKRAEPVLQRLRHLNLEDDGVGVGRRLRNERLYGPRAAPSSTRTKAMRDSGERRLDAPGTAGKTTNLTQINKVKTMSAAARAAWVRVGRERSSLL